MRKDDSSEASDDEDEHDGEGDVRVSVANGSSSVVPASGSAAIASPYADTSTADPFSTEDVSARLQEQMFPGKKEPEWENEAETSSAHRLGNKNIFDDESDTGSNSDSDDLFSRKPPAVRSPLPELPDLEDVADEEHGEAVNDGVGSERREDKEEKEKKEVVPKPSNFVRPLFAEELARKIGAPQPRVNDDASATRADAESTDMLRESEEDGTRAEEEDAKLIPDPADTTSESLNGLPPKGNDVVTPLETPQATTAMTQEQMAVKSKPSSPRRSEGGGQQVSNANQQSANISTGANANRRSKTVLDDPSKPKLPQESIRRTSKFSQKAQQQSSKKLPKSLFDDDSDSEDTFAPRTMATRKALSAEPEKKEEIKAIPKKAASEPPTLASAQKKSARTKKSLFEDSDDESSDSSDIFSSTSRKTSPKKSQPSPKTKEVEPTVKKKILLPTSVVSSDSSDIFSRETSPKSLHSTSGTSIVVSGDHLAVNNETLDNETLVSTAKASSDTMQKPPKSAKSKTQDLFAGDTEDDGDDEDDDIFSALKVQSRKMINSDIKKAEEKGEPVGSDSDLFSAEPAQRKSPTKPITRGSLFEDSSDDSDDELFSTPRAVVPDSNAVEGNVKSPEEREASKSGSDEGDGNFISRSKKPKTPSVARDDSQGKEKKPETSVSESGAEAAAATQSKGDNEVGSTTPQEEDPPSAATSVMASESKDSDGGGDEEAVRPRMHVVQFGSAFRNSLAQTLAKGPLSPKASPVREVPPPQPVTEEESKNEVEERDLLVGVNKNRARIGRQRRPPTREGRRAAAARPTGMENSNDVVDAGPAAVTLPEEEKEKTATDLPGANDTPSETTSSPDPLRLPPSMPSDSSVKSDETGPSRETKSPSPARPSVGPWLDPSQHATPETSRSRTPSPGGRKRTTSGPWAVEPSPKLQAAKRADGAKDDKPLFDSTEENDEGDLFARPKPAKKVERGKKAEKKSLFDTSSDSDDLFGASAKKS